jgi:amidase
MDAIISSLGPLTRSARDLALFMDAVLAGEPWLLEPAVLEIPWRVQSVGNQDLMAKLSVAILWDDGVVHPHPPITHALKDLEVAMVKAGHDVIRWEPMNSPNHQEARDLICKLYFLDGAEQKRQIMQEGHDPFVPQTEFILSFAPDISLLPTEIWESHAERDAFRAMLLTHWLATANRTKSGRPVDVILSPVAPTLAPPHDTTRWWGYSSYWNLADYPGVVFPVRSSTGHDATPMPAARNAVEEFVQKQWDPKTYAGAPISLQLVARRLNEEKLLHALSVVEDVIKRNNAGEIGLFTNLHDGGF